MENLEEVDNNSSDSNEEVRPIVRKTYSRKKNVIMSRKTDTTSSSSSEVAEPSPTPPPEIEVTEEVQHFFKVIEVFKKYSKFQIQQIYTYFKRLDVLPEPQQELLRDYREGLNSIIHCIVENQNVINDMIKNAENLFLNMKYPLNLVVDIQATLVDIEKIQSTFKQIVREWSEEGASERNTCYEPIIKEIIRNFPPHKRKISEVKVLVPGSGLGRLPFEIVSRGYSCEGNEFSLYMLIVSHFILNKSEGIKTYSLYPWVHQVDNNMSHDDQTRCIKIPDINPRLVTNVEPLFSMAAGDFLEVYNEAKWDCIATCFFIDCSHNIVEIIEKIYALLKPGGVWINLGPLLYHFSNNPSKWSIEPPYNVIKNIITKVGFIMEREETDVKTSYCRNTRSMLQYTYRCVFFVCHKPGPTE